MEETKNFLTWFDELGTVGLAAVLGLVLFGNFLNVWVWGKAHEKIIKDLQERHDEAIQEMKDRLAKCEMKEEEWKAMSLSLMRLGERIANGDDDSPPIPQRRKQLRG